MSGQSAKRRKTSAVASAGGRLIDTLPPELLETILDFLDVQTLCTARLVCTEFHGAASRSIHSVELSIEDLRSRPETTLNNFLKLSRVSIFDVQEDDLLMLGRSPLAGAVTHLLAVNNSRDLPQCGRVAASLPIMPLPNLMSLTVSHAPCHAFPFPQTLRELTLEHPFETLQTANLVASLTNLTCLRIDVGGLPKPFEAVAALTALQRLEICCSLTLTPFVAELTLLTHLQFRDTRGLAQPSDLALASLSRLQRLVHLGHPSTSSEFRQVVASIGRITSLRSLHLRAPQGSAFSTVCMTPFSQLTALRLEGYGLDASFLSRVNLERLQDLSLSYGVELHGEGVAALRRATGLTNLELWTAGRTLSPKMLGAALARMSHLRAFSFTTPFQASFCHKAIAPLTGLTRLKLSGRGVTTNAGVKVCLGLKKLRVLRIPVPWDSPSAVSDRITPETFFAIAKLPELRKLDMTGNIEMWQGELRDDVRAWLDAERIEKGWPPLELDISC